MNIGSVREPSSCCLAGKGPAGKPLSRGPIGRCFSFSLGARHTSACFFSLLFIYLLFLVYLYYYTFSWKKKREIMRKSGKGRFGLMHSATFHGI